MNCKLSDLHVHDAQFQFQKNYGWLKSKSENWQWQLGMAYWKNQYQIPVSDKLIKFADWKYRISDIGISVGRGGTYILDIGRNKNIGYQLEWANMPSLMIRTPSINADQHSGIDPNVDQIGIERHFGSMPWFWSALIGIGHWSGESCNDDNEWQLGMTYWKNQNQISVSDKFCIHFNDNWACINGWICHFVCKVCLPICKNINGLMSRISACQLNFRRDALRIHDTFFSKTTGNMTFMPFLLDWTTSQDIKVDHRKWSNVSFSVICNLNVSCILNVAILKLRWITCMDTKRIKRRFEGQFWLFRPHKVR